MGMGKQFGRKAAEEGRSLAVRWRDQRHFRHRALRGEMV